MMTKQIKLLTITCLAGWLIFSLSAAPVSVFAPGEIWRDTSGNPITRTAAAFFITTVFITGMAS